jgi:uncharacterized protein (DUF952 family)
MAPHIYHITTRDAWRRCQAQGRYQPKEFETEGFIHCSYVHQLLDVAERLFKGRNGLVLLVIDRSRLSCKVVDESSPDAPELFPHVYGPLPLEAVVEIVPFPRQSNGAFVLPSGLEG